MHESLGFFLCLTLRGYRIVVPEDLWAQLMSLQREAIWPHELTHRVRNDVLKSLSARLLDLFH